MENRPHVLFLSPGFPKDENDSRCIPAMQLFIQELINRKQFEISIISFHYPYKPAEYSWNGVKVYAIGGNNKKGLSRLVLLNKAYRLALKLHRSNPFSRVHSFWLGECALVGNRIARKFNLLHSCTMMGQDVLKENPYLKRIKELPTLITLSNIHQEKLLESSGIKAQWNIPWGIEGVFDSTVEERSIDILGVGNLTQLKSFDRFLEIVFLVKKKHQNVKGLIIGEGNQRELAKKIEDLKLSGNIQIEAERSRGEVIERMKKSKCFLHTSRFESFGMVLCEALSSGAYVYSTAVGIAPELADVKVYHTNQEAADGILDCLSTQTVFKGAAPLLIKDTVDNYLNKVFLS